ncbi:MAG: sulfatase-like hydrolase/transferase [Verrucomicrobiales bacterium]|nr:sulfatase-like hydrolase/transferase [Verrucomicrobiales bacterium]
MRVAPAVVVTSITMIARLAFLLLIFGFASGEDLTRREAPNVILVMSDDQGWGDVGYNGHPLLKTPNLDAAAEAGFRFDSFYAAAPSCSPTRASVLTGRHPNRMGVFSWGHSIRPQETTLAEVLRENGYMTGHFGKWHLGSVRADSPVNPGKNGFDRWFSAPNFFDINPTMSDEGREVKIEGESSEVTVDAALEWIAEVAMGDAPLFAVVWFGSPHYPHRASKADAAVYADQPKKNREFLGEVTGIDRAFGKLRSGLRELGIEENTLLWFTSDNGALKKVGDSGGYRGSKHHVYEGGLRVPAFIEWPAQISPGQHSTVRSTTSDILPTILQVAGVDLNKLPRLDGISLLPLLAGKMKTRPVPIGFWNARVPGHFTNPAGVFGKVIPTVENWSDRKISRVTKRVEKIPEKRTDIFHGHAAWISGDWKLHRFSMNGSKRVTWQLFDLLADPGEENDISGEHPDVLHRMQGEMENWLVSVVQSLNGGDY